MTYIPVYLKGGDLGARHRYFNNLIKSAVNQKEVLQVVIQTPEQSPIDRIFKIDLASEHRQVDFILQNFQDDNMLFVSRALKCLWLLDPQFADIINPTHLETKLFPHMIQPAVTKTRHWLQLHLKDPKRCQQFYEYYKYQFNLAIKFLLNCSIDFIIGEFCHVMDKITPKYFKILCETNPRVSEMYFEKLPSNRTALTNYIKHEKDFFQSFKSILKLNGNLYLDILEKHYNIEKLGNLNPAATHYILKQYRSRFIAKPELYATMFLHVKTLAKHLTPDEAKDLVLRLGRAEYLSSWFTYQNVEPLIKRLKAEERASLKNQVFVDKSVGTSVKEWPYVIPLPFEQKISDCERVFLDKEHDPYEYDVAKSFKFCKKLKKRKMYCYGSQHNIVSIGKSPLDVMFNRYRFTGFERTFEELSKKILSESSIDGRLNMLLVLVSKSGGVTEQIDKLLKWLVEKHINEPINLRAAVIRSFVKRGCIWRLPAEPWELLLQFGRDLGLEGQTAELLCREGLHAVIIRQLIADAEPSPDLILAFVQEFSTLHEYKLNTLERALIGPRLAILMVKINPNAFLDILTEYQLNICHIPSAFGILIKSARNDPDLARRLFDAKIGRRELLRESFPLKQDNASYLNVLKHDVSLLENGKTFTTLVAKESPRHDRFLKCLNLYFNEPNGLAAQHQILLKENVASKFRSQLARPICLLSSEKSLLDYLSEIDAMGILDKKQLQFVASIRANAHTTTPALDINKVDWEWIGAKAVANRVFICKSNDLNRYIKLLLEWKRTARVALHLGILSPSSIETFTHVSSIRPTVALKFSLSVYFKRNNIEPQIWIVTKQLIENLDPSKINNRLLLRLCYNKSIPESIKADYWVVIFNMLLKINNKEALPILCRLENLLPSVDDRTIERVIEQFMSDELIIEKCKSNEYIDNAEKRLYVRIIAKYLLLSKSESIQNNKLKICDAFFDKLELLFDTCSDTVIECLDDFLLALKYNKAFMDQQYVFCVPVFEKVITRLRKILPIEKHFSCFIKIHLTMLYYKSIKQSIKQKPDTFGNLELNGKEAMKDVGYIFGKYIGTEVKELVSRYFFSIIEVYKEVLVKYISEYFEYNDKMSMLVVFIIKGLLNVGCTESLLLAEHLMHRKYEFFISSSDADEILNILKKQKSQEITYLVSANHCS